MKRNHNKISPTAFNHIFWRTYFGLPLAHEFSEVSKKYEAEKIFFNAELLSKTAPIIEARYRSGEKAMEGFIKRNPHCIILELAAGFSLHGLNLSSKYPKITYIETDLPDNLGLKKKIVSELGAHPKNLYFRSANALSQPALERALSAAGKKRKIAIFCEGLLSYFNKEEMKKIASVVGNLLEKYGGVWIATDPALNNESRKELKHDVPDWKKAMQRAENIVGQKYAQFGFASEEEADAFFERRGFKIKKENWTLKLRSLKSKYVSRAAAKKMKKFFRKYGRVWILSKR